MENDTFGFFETELSQPLGTTRNTIEIFQKRKRELKVNGSLHPCSLSWSLSFLRKTSFHKTDLSVLQLDGILAIVGGGYHHASLSSAFHC